MRGSSALIRRGLYYEFRRLPTAEQNQGLRQHRHGGDTVFLAPNGSRNADVDRHAVK